MTNTTTTTTTEELVLKTIVFGDFKQFLLAQRSEIRVESSTEVQFTSDNTVFKGVGFYDGKATKAEAFAVVTITATPAQG